MSPGEIFPVFYDKIAPTPSLQGRIRIVFPDPDLFPSVIGSGSYFNELNKLTLRENFNVCLLVGSWQTY
jgi:hypothetical protein